MEFSTGLANEPVREIPFEKPFKLLFFLLLQVTASMAKKATAAQIQGVVTACAHTLDRTSPQAAGNRAQPPATGQQLDLTVLTQSHTVGVVTTIGTQCRQQHPSGSAFNPGQRALVAEGNANSEEQEEYKPRRVILEKVCGWHWEVGGGGRGRGITGTRGGH